VLGIGKITDLWLRPRKERLSDQTDGQRAIAIATAIRELTSTGGSCESCRDTAVR
jgi:hypothetical protein